MSTTTTFDDVRHADTLTGTTTRTETGKPGFLDRLIEGRMRQGKARVAAYLHRQSDQTLAGLGFSADEIAAIRASGEIPASFWR